MYSGVLRCLCDVTLSVYPHLACENSHYFAAPIITSLCDVILIGAAK
jgi:hypothetical protein